MKTNNSFISSPAFYSGSDVAVLISVPMYTTTILDRLENTIFKNFNMDNRFMFPAMINQLSISIAGDAFVDQSTGHGFSKGNRFVFNGFTVAGTMTCHLAPGNLLERLSLLKAFYSKASYNLVQGSKNTLKMSLGDLDITNSIPISNLQDFPDFDLFVSFTSEYGDSLFDPENIGKNLPPSIMQINNIRLIEISTEMSTENIFTEFVLRYVARNVILPYKASDFENTTLKQLIKEYNKKAEEYDDVITNRENHMTGYVYSKR